MLEFTFSRKDVIGWPGKWVVIKRGRWKIQKSSFDHLREGVNKWK